MKRVFRYMLTTLLAAMMLALMCTGAAADRINDEAFRPAAKERAAQIVAQTVTQGMGEYEKALALYDWLCANVEYDDGYISTGNCTSEYGVDLAGAMLGGWAVCEGFAEAYELMLELSGLEAEKIVGWGGGAYGGGHAWVAAKVEGAWHLFDPTWDQAGDGQWHDYFGLNEEAFDLLHNKETHNNLYCNGFAANYKYREGLYADTLSELIAAVEDGLNAGTYTGELVTTAAWDTRDQIMMAAILSAKEDWSVSGRVEMTAQTAAPYGFAYTFYPDERPVTAIELQGVNEYARYTRMYPGYSVQLAPVTTPAGIPVTYKSMDESVLTVTPEGLLTAVGTGEGSVEISANGLKYVLSVWVYEIDQLGFWVTAGDYSTRTGLRIGETTQAMDVSGCSEYLLMAEPGITWTSDDPSIAVVDENGLITAVGNGITHIRADWRGLLQCELEINVREPLTSITIAQREYHFDMTELFVYLEAVVDGPDVKAYYEQYGSVGWNWDGMPVVSSCQEYDMKLLEESGYTRYRELFMVNMPGAMRMNVRGEDLGDAQDSCLIYVHCEDVIRLPQDIIAVEQEAFAGSAAQEFILPEGAQRIASRAFAGCKNLQMIILPPSVTQIAEDAFEGCGDVLIVCWQGSAAHDYAIAHGMRATVL